MAKPRAQLDQILRGILKEIDPELENDHLYFNPPSGWEMNYPCIVYNIENDNVNYADNKRYYGMNRYSITVIDENIDSLIPDLIKELPYCSWRQTFSTDDLTHFVFTLFY